MVEFTIKVDVFVHQLINPPSNNAKNDINLEIINSSRNIKLYKTGSNSVSKYLLYVENPLKIGFTSHQQFIINQEVQNLILAFNLCLSTSCLTPNKIEFLDSKIDIINPPTQSFTKKSGKLSEVFINESYSMNETVSTVIGYKEDIDECCILNVFEKLQRTNRFNINTGQPLRLHNLSKALSVYESSMKGMDLIDKFKHIFNAIEIATNYDGIKREGDKFDKEVEKLTFISESNIRSWRKDYYNRFKHYDTNLLDRNTYLKSTELIKHYLPELRKCSKTVLLSRL